MAKRIRRLKTIRSASLAFENTFGKKIAPKNWEDFLNQLSEEFKSRDEIIYFFIDEFPWLNVKGGYFVDDFGTFWNLYIDILSALKVI